MNGIVKILRPGLPEVGKIKIGIKGAVVQSQGGKSFQPPKKLDHFVVTGLNRGPDNNFVRDATIHEEIGDQPKELPIRLIYDDPALNFYTRLVCFQGRIQFCTGDGEKAQRLQGKQLVDYACPCERINQDYTPAEGRCKVAGMLSCILDCQQIVGGVWKFRTTSWNTCQALTGSLALISRITGGVLAGLPLTLAIRPKTVVAPGTQHTQTVYVVGIEFRGTMDQLAEEGLKRALAMAKSRERIELIEDLARASVRAEIPLLTAGENDDDLLDEHFPEQATAAAVTTMDPVAAQEVRADMQMPPPRSAVRPQETAPQAQPPVAPPPDARTTPIGAPAAKPQYPSTDPAFSAMLGRMGLKMADVIPFLEGRAHEATMEIGQPVSVFQVAQEALRNEGVFLDAFRAHKRARKADPPSDPVPGFEDVWTWEGFLQAQGPGFPAELAEQYLVEVGAEVGKDLDAMKDWVRQNEEVFLKQYGFYVDEHTKRNEQAEASAPAEGAEFGDQYGFPVNDKAWAAMVGWCPELNISPLLAARGVWHYVALKSKRDGIQYTAAEALKTLAASRSVFQGFVGWVFKQDMGVLSSYVPDNVTAPAPAPAPGFSDPAPTVPGSASVDRSAEDVARWKDMRGSKRDPDKFGFHAYVISHLAAFRSANDQVKAMARKKHASIYGGTPACPF